MPTEFVRRQPSLDISLLEKFRIKISSVQKRLLVVSKRDKNLLHALRQVESYQEHMDDGGYLTITVNAADPVFELLPVGGLGKKVYEIDLPDDIQPHPGLTPYERVYSLGGGRYYLRVNDEYALINDTAQGK